MITRIYQLLLVIVGFIFMAILAYYLNFPIDLKVIVSYLRTRQSNQAIL